MFTEKGEAVRVREWTSGRKEPALPLQWAPHAVWMACDGSVGVTYGSWHQGEALNGWFATVWQRQKNGSYKWVLDQGDATAKPLPAPEWIEAKVGDCPRAGRRVVSPKPSEAPAEKGPVDHLNGHSRDNTLEWSTEAGEQGARVFVLRLKTEGQWHEVLRRAAAVHS